MRSSDMIVILQPHTFFHTGCSGIRTNTAAYLFPSATSCNHESHIYMPILTLIMQKKVRKNQFNMNANSDILPNEKYLNTMGGINS